MFQRLEAIVVGGVQGVGFRVFVHAKAIELGLKGYTGNLPDGSVKVVAEGEKEELLVLLSALEKGPALSRVDEVRKIFSPAKNEFQYFEVKH